jgi:hypothetical protein
MNPKHLNTRETPHNPDDRQIGPDQQIQRFLDGEFAGDMELAPTDTIPYDPAGDSERIANGEW